jgi:hypothetical protein
MAGLIEQEMEAPPTGQEPQPQDPMQAQAGQPPAQPGGQQGAESDDVPDHPAFDAAMEFVMQVLYNNKAAKDIANQIKSAPSVSEGLADIAYNITSIVDEKTQGQVPDDLLGVLAMSILGEVSEVAEAAGVNPTEQDVANAFKNMLLRYMGEQGADTSQLQQAMDQVDPKVFQQAA